MTRENRKQSNKQNGTDANRDPITGKPAGTGVLVAGPAARSLARKGVADKMDPTAEDAYWKTNYSKQKYVERNAPYATYQPAYRTGYEGRCQYPGKRFDEVETSLQRDYEKSQGKTGLAWSKARHAIRDAWQRVETALPGDADGDGR